MMRTEDDIRQALDAGADYDAIARLTAFAAHLDDVGEAEDFSGLGVAVAPVGSGEHRRRAVSLLAAAVVLALGAAWVAAAVRPSTDSGAGADRSAQQRRPVWNVRVAPVTGYTATRVNASSIGLASGSTTFIAATDARRPERGVMTTCPGLFSSCAQPPGTTEAVRVHGQQGFFTPGRHVGRGSLSVAAYLEHPWLAAVEADDGPALTWDAGHDTTVFLSGTFGFDPHTFAYHNAAAKKILLRIASATTAGHRDATHLPFALTGLPDSVEAETVRVGHGGACGQYGTGPRGSSDPLGIVFTACRVATGVTSTATIHMADQVDSNSVNGTADFQPDHPIVYDVSDGTSIVIALEPDQRSVSIKQARDLAAHADTSPKLKDQSTWIAVG